MSHSLTRRSALAAAVALITYRAAPATAAPIYAAIRRAKAADAADREAGRLPAPCSAPVAPSLPTGVPTAPISGRPAAPPGSSFTP